MPVSSRQIGAPDRVAEQGIARHQLILLRNPNTHTALRMAGRFQNLEVRLPQLQHGTVFGRAVHFRAGRWRDAEPVRLHIQSVKQFPIAFIHIHRRSRQRAQLVSAGHMVDMRVRNDDTLDR